MAMEAEGIRDFAKESPALQSNAGCCSLSALQSSSEGLGTLYSANSVQDCEGYDEYQSRHSTFDGHREDREGK